MKFNSGQLLQTYTLFQVTPSTTCNTRQSHGVCGKPRSHSQMKSCEYALIANANVNGYLSICSVVRQFAALFAIRQ